MSVRVPQEDGHGFPVFRSLFPTGFLTGVGRALRGLRPYVVHRPDIFNAVVVFNTGITTVAHLTFSELVPLPAAC